MNLKKTLCLALLCFSTRSYADTINTIDAAALLGDGYNSVTGEFADNCYTGTLNYTGTPDGDLKLDTRITTDKLLTEMGIKAGAEINLEVIKASGAVDFFAKVKADDASISNTFNYTIKGHQVAFRNLRLNDFGKEILAQAFNQSSQTPSDYFYGICGDQVVDKIDMQSSLILSMKAEFSNLEIKTHFNAQMDVDLIEIIKANASANTKFEKYKDNMTIRITARQRGGDPSKLGHILPTEGLASCKIDNLGPCKKVLEELQKYVTDENHGFSKQLADMTYNPSKPGGLGFKTYYTKSVKSAGIPDLQALDNQSIIGLQIKETRQKILREYLRLSEDYIRADYLLYDGIRLTQQQKDEIRKAMEIIQDNRGRLQVVFETCRKDIEKCVDTYAKHKSKVYDDDVLIKEMTFYDYCYMPEVKKYTIRTVNRIKASLDIDDEELLNDCQYLEDNILQYQKSIDLSFDKGSGESQIVDLSPLATMSRLEKVVVQNQNVVSLDFVRKLENLKHLDVSNNNIRNITPLANNQKLTYLNISMNPISWFTTLPTLENLEVLRAYGANDEDIIEVIDDLDIENAIYTAKQLCEIERVWALSKGKITKGEYMFNKDLDMIPAYKNPHNPDNSSISAWVTCEPVGFSQILLRSEWDDELPKLEL